MIVDLTALDTGNYDRERFVLSRGTIKTPARHKDETDFEWNGRRHAMFVRTLMTETLTHKPEVLITEVSSGVFKFKDTEENRKRYGPGSQFRAGIGLGRALGWLDSFIFVSIVPLEVFPMETREAKMRVTGSSGADKAAVADALRRVYGWDLTGWDEAQIDALAVAQAYAQNLEHESKLVNMTEEQREVFASFTVSDRKEPSRPRKTRR